MLIHASSRITNTTYKCRWLKQICYRTRKINIFVVNMITSWVYVIGLQFDQKWGEAIETLSVNLKIHWSRVQFTIRSTRLYIRLDHDWIHEIDFTNKVNIYIYLHIYIDHRKIKKHLLILKTPCILVLLVCTNFYSLKIRTSYTSTYFFCDFFFAKKIDGYLILVISPAVAGMFIVQFQICCIYICCSVRINVSIHFFSFLVLLFVIVWIVPL